MDLEKELAPYAQQVGRQYGILPAFIMAVATLESANGTSGLCTEANNLFGIKGSYNGQSVTMPTKEYEGGRWITVNAAFKKYPSFRESCQDFCDLIKNGVSWDRSIYSKAVIGKTDLNQVFVDFAKTPYMTDPAYAAKLMAVTQQHNLAKYDTVTAAPAPANEQTQEFKSIVNFLKANGKDSSFAARAILAKENGIQNYTGTAAQNVELLKKLEDEAKAPAAHPATNKITLIHKGKYAEPAGGWNLDHIEDWLKAHEADPSFSARQKYAAEAGIMNYSGTAAENNKLLEILKEENK